MKQNKSSDKLMWFRIAVILNTLAVAGYVLYSEWQKQQPRFVNHTCEIVATDQERNLIALKCLED